MRFDIAVQRLNNQRLVGAPLATPADAVRWLGAVQAQDYPAAKWGLAVRTRTIRDTAIDKAFNGGAFLRTHAMRPTWHFLAPEDLRWILALTSPRVQLMNGSQYRRLELSDAVLRRAQKIITSALAGGVSLTRAELAKVLEAKGIPATGQRAAYIMMHAELEALVCSGPLRGKQHTYALLEERVPPAKLLTGDEAGATLARRYFNSHGPATAHDFAWWSGLTVTAAKRAIESLGADIESTAFDLRTYWTPAQQRRRTIKPPVVHLLPNYDEHVVAYRHHGPSLDPRTPNAIDNWGNALTAHLVVLNGLIVGGWRRDLEADHVVLRFSLLTKLRGSELSALKRAAERFGAFLGLPAVLIFQTQGQ